MSTPPVSVLAALSESGPCSQKEISDEQDRRRYAVEITDLGRDLLDARVDVAAEIDDLLFEGLTAVERDQLAELLPKAYAHHEGRR